VHTDFSVAVHDTATLEQVWRTAAPRETTYGELAALASGPRPFIGAADAPLPVDLAFVRSGDLHSSQLYRQQRLDAKTGKVRVESVMAFPSPLLPEGSPLPSVLGGLSASTWIAADGEDVRAGSIAMITSWPGEDWSTVRAFFSWRGNPASSGLTAGVAAGPSGSILVTQRDGSVVRYDTTTGEQIGPVVDSQVGAASAIASDAGRTRAVVSGRTVSPLFP
jgi:hypothetical protein